MAVFKPDFVDNKLVYFIDEETREEKFLEIRYDSKSDETEKYHPDLVPAESDHDHLRELVIEHFSKDDLVPFLFRKLEDEEWDALLERINSIILCRMSSEDIMKLPGRHPWIITPSQSEINQMSDEEYKAYNDAIDKYVAKYLPKHLPGTASLKCLRLQRQEIADHLLPSGKRRPSNVEDIVANIEMTNFTRRHEIDSVILRA